MNFPTKFQMQLVKLKDTQRVWKTYYPHQNLSIHDQLGLRIYGIAVLFFINSTSREHCFHRNLRLLRT